MNVVKDKKLKVRKSNAQKAYDEGKPDQKELLETLWPGEFKPVDVTDRIKTWDDVLADQGETAESFKSKTVNDDDDVVSYKEQKMLSRCLNELKPGERLDPSKPWYYPVFNRNSGSGFACVFYGLWDSTASVGERLCYKEPRLARFAGETFPEKFKPFMLDLSGGSKI